MLRNAEATSTCTVASNVAIGASGRFVTQQRFNLLTDADCSLLDWLFQHYTSVDIRMSRDRNDEVGNEQWCVSTWDRTRTWRTGTALTLSDAIKSLIARIYEVENEQAIWKLSQQS